VSLGIPRRAAVTIGTRVFPYRRWAGRPLPADDRWLAFDTKTEEVDLRKDIPRLALVTASAGPRANVVVHPDDIGAFILAHRNRRFVCHNAAFDFWVIEAHLRGRGEEEARALWWEIVEGNRLHDSMLLDMLQRLAQNDTFPDPRNLGVVARQYASLEISKDDPYRKRYGEILGKDWAEVDTGFFEYAVKDSIATLPTYRALRQHALALVKDFGDADVRSGARRDFGLLTEAVQVKTAIALAQITRDGLAVDLPAVRQAEADLRQRLEEAVAHATAAAPGVYKTSKDGSLVRGGKFATPSKSQAALIAQLEKAAAEIQEEIGAPVAVPLTPKTKKPSTSLRFWAEYREHHTFLRHWVAAEELGQLLPFFAGLQEERVHPRYTTMVRTGRTSASDPNIQQIPRGSAFRRVFTASPGHFLLVVDYTAVELCTLAATALHRYGWSDLADVLAAGVDPHAHTAALMLGVPPEAFLRWKDDDTVVERRVVNGKEVVVTRKDKFAQARQGAKAVNFGVPGGLGAASLAAYAKHTYKAELTLEQAQEHRERLTREIYKELALYLAEDGAAIVARNLGVPLEKVRKELDDIHISSVRKILTGDPKRRDGEPYQERFVSRVWDALARLNRCPELRQQLKDRQAGTELAARVCHAGVATLTGRIRGRVSYSQARNTPFQGLAADGAGLALFALVKEGFRVVGFVHDEFLVELPDEGGFVSESVVRRVEEILRTEMRKVLPKKIPVKCEKALSSCWDKKAKLVVRNGKVFPGS
jgi:DNA polymerase I-like protein with 3'-5' exonuclease and polymerase domains